MEKAYYISNIRFENDYMIIIVDDKTIRFRLEDISEKLAGATDQERLDFRITPSGYGIHWNLIDEDLSVNGLLETTQ